MVKKETFIYQRKIKCKKCDGLGVKNKSLIRECTLCYGTGKDNSNKTNWTYDFSNF